MLASQTILSRGYIINLIHFQRALIEHSYHPLKYLPANSDNVLQPKDLPLSNRNNFRRLFNPQLMLLYNDFSKNANFLIVF